MQITLPTYQDVVDASTRLEGVANATPVLTSRTIDDEIGAKVFSNVKTTNVPALSNSGEHTTPSRNSAKRNAEAVLWRSPLEITRKASH